MQKLQSMNPMKGFKPSPQHELQRILTLASKVKETVQELEKYKQETEQKTVMANTNAYELLTKVIQLHSDSRYLSTEVINKIIKCTQDIIQGPSEALESRFYRMVYFLRRIYGVSNALKQYKLDPYDLNKILRVARIDLAINHCCPHRGMN